MTTVFDLDGTLVRHEGRPGYGSPEALEASSRPVVEACQRVKSLLLLGERVVFLSARHESLRRETLRQLREWISPYIHDSDVYLSPHEWKGYLAMEESKAKVLAVLGADLFVGDHEADERAARRANVRFLYVHEWLGVGAKQTALEVSL